MNQCERIKEWLESGKAIDPLTSWNELGIYRLASRISDLKKAGMQIHKRDKPVLNRFGETCIVAEYYL